MESIFEKEKALVNIELVEVISLLRRLLLPIVDSISNDQVYVAEWKHELHSWTQSIERI